MITLKNVSLRRGTNLLLKDVNWTIYHKQRIGLIGENGSGKTSLFSLLLSQLEADTGEIDLPKRLKLVHVAQETEASDKSALDFVLEGDQELIQLEKELKIAEEKNDGHEIATIHARFGEIDAYTAPARAAQLLNGLGFSQTEQAQSMRSFSGGWRVRLNLAKALMGRGDILLLDEPTNHLDLDAVIWLEKWLIDYPGTLLLISHDRDFLDRVVDHIAHISHQELKVYAGDYSNFEKQRADALLLQQAAFEKQQKHIAHLRKFIDRFKAKASKARQAQSRVKAIERMEIISAVQEESPFHFHFREPTKCPNPLLRLEDAEIAYVEKKVLNDLNISITPKDRIALLGPNGAGKSSLIKLLAAEIQPVAGTRIAGAGLNIGYFAQHQVDHLHLHETPLDHLRKIAPNVREQELRTYLGSFGFPEKRVHEQVKIFSGGEKSRLALALIIWQKPNLLLLDEPTNHLDLEMRQALSLALQEYEGAMILVSHDRFLVRSTVDQLMLVANQKLSVYDGDLNDYERWLFQFRKETNSLFKPSVPPSPKLDIVEREQRKSLVNEIKKLEMEMEKLQKQLTVIEKKLTENPIYEEKQKQELLELLSQQSTLQNTLREKENAWLKATERLGS
jgi:ATP-binding cassette subfamily F protein 3